MNCEVVIHAQERKKEKLEKQNFHLRCKLKARVRLECGESADCCHSFVRRIGSPTLKCSCSANQRVLWYVLLSDYKPLFLWCSSPNETTIFVMFFRKWNPIIVFSCSMIEMTFWWVVPQIVPQLKQIYFFPGCKFNEYHIFWWIWHSTFNSDDIDKHILSFVVVVCEWHLMFFAMSNKTRIV